MDDYRLSHLGESNIEIRVESKTISFFKNLRDEISHKKFDGVHEVIAYPGSVFLHFDPLIFDLNRFVGEIHQINVSQERNSSNIKPAKIPVCYHNDFALDRKELEQKFDLKYKQIIEIHLKNQYFLEMYGFIPGFIYLKGLDNKIQLPRKQEPAVKIPAGSIAIANEYCGIYPSDSPGGWYVIGRTPLSIFDPSRNPVFLFEPGQEVSFYSITKEEFEFWQK